MLDNIGLNSRSLIFPFFFRFMHFSFTIKLSRWRSDRVYFRFYNFHFDVSNTSSNFTLNALLCMVTYFSNYSLSNIFKQFLHIFSTVHDTNSLRLACLKMHIFSFLEKFVINCLLLQGAFFIVSWHAFLVLVFKGESLLFGVIKDFN